MHASTALQKLAFELPKLRFRAHNLFDGLLKGLLKCTIDEAGGVLGATPEGMGRHVLLSVKVTLNAIFNMF